MGTVLLGIISGVTTYLVAKPKVKVDVQTAINQGFSTLVQELQEEATELRQLVREQTACIQTLQRQVMKLDRHVIHLHELLERHGITPPAHPIGTGI
jgi:hypothetical protein